MRLSISILAATAALLSCPAAAFADDLAAPKGTPERAGTLEFGAVGARFHVERDRAAGRMSVRLLDPAIKLERAPVIVLPPNSDPREVTLVPVEGRDGEWTWSSDLVRSDRFDGSLRIVVAGKPYVSSLATVWEASATAAAKLHAPRYGGQVVSLSNCGVCVEVVQDATRGALTIYSFDDVVVSEAPVVTVTEAKGPTEITLAKVDGKTGVWAATNDAFKTSPMAARIRVSSSGKGCEAPLAPAAVHGGQVVTIVDGPTFEVVKDAKAGSYTFYAVDETYEGKAYVIERPTVVVGTRTYELAPVPGEPRAWRLIGLDAAGTDARDAQLNFTLFGKTLSTRVGLSGLGVGVR